MLTRQKSKMSCSLSLSLVVVFDSEWLMFGCVQITFEILFLLFALVLLRIQRAEGVCHTNRSLCCALTKTCRINKRKMYKVLNHENGNWSYSFEHTIVLNEEKQKRRLQNTNTWQWCLRRRRRTRSFNRFNNKIFHLMMRSSLVYCFLIICYIYNIHIQNCCLMLDVWFVFRSIYKA